MTHWSLAGSPPTRPELRARWDALSDAGRRAQALTFWGGYDFWHEDLHTRYAACRTDAERSGVYRWECENSIWSTLPVHGDTA